MVMTADLGRQLSEETPIRAGVGEAGTSGG